MTGSTVELVEHISVAQTEEIDRPITVEELEQRVGMFTIAALKGTASVAIPGAVIEFGTELITGKPLLPIKEVAVMTGVMAVGQTINFLRTRLSS